MPAIKTVRLSFAYPGLQVFRDLDFFDASSLILLEGPSGCGKTTLLKLLAGALPCPTTSLILISSPALLVLQEDALFPWLTVKGNLLCCNWWHGFKAYGPEFESLLSAVEPLQSTHAYKLSYGQRRLVELLRALTSPAPILLLDEPLNFLDPLNRSIIVELITFLASKNKQFVISSHYAEDFATCECTVYRFSRSLPISILTKQ